MDSSLAIAIISTSAFTALLTLTLKRLDWRRRNKQAKGYLRGIQLEIAYGQECADAYVTKVDEGRPVWAPGYRIVTEYTRSHVRPGWPQRVT